MAKVFIEETTLTAIGDAIRGKEGTAELVPVNDMASRITSLPSGGGGGNEPTADELAVTGDCLYRFAYNHWNWLLSKYSNKITVQNITKLAYIFTGSSALTSIPFTINVNNCSDFKFCFYSCSGLTTTPKIRGTVKVTTATTFDGALDGCEKIPDVEDLLTPEMLDGWSTPKITSAYSAPAPIKLKNLKSIRRIPSWWYKFRLNPESTAIPTSTYSIYYEGFNSCHALDEITNIPVWASAGALTSNAFSNAFPNVSRAKSITFETNAGGTPIVASWKAQTIDLTSYVGYVKFSSQITSYNSEVKSAPAVTSSNYQELKDSPDYWTTNISYSRYNHDSAVETINSLPDTSAYLASAGGTNTIKFKGASGSDTDGGAINTLTEEEIAVAAAKGWTVTLV